ncbi:SemiSWEET family transporter [Wolbachia endosymbiont of Drosophila bocki]|uniref:SemiSWEET family sugar transporter n=1 Tax=Wolbachia endosymbiont of Drosophila bocki TaxID=3002576 RepID=UPI0023A99FD4|nr:SemiSWEET family transporter [Wolbachia endosymbiont of Drosophila bocki]MDE5057684.1 SemiSWEET family transporter [Wolbachia endosymbiont of Drosophila bocki]
MYINIEECFGFVALIASLIGLSPQVYKAYITKVTRDVSMLMLVNYLICSLSWIGYGLYQSSIFVVLSNIAGLMISIISIIQKCYYDAKPAP